ncbi:MAG: photosynthetic complex assembly protein PuhC [Pseudomonadota bacterium]
MIIDHNAHDHFKLHTIPVVMMASVVVISIALTASVTLGFFERQAVPSEIRAAAGTDEVSSRTLRFFDEPDGTVRIEDGASGEALASYGPGTGGFVRSTARSLVHGRRIRGIGSEVPFTLTLWDNGQLTLRDPTTDRAVELASFGDTNRAVFSELLNEGSN